MNGRNGSPSGAFAPLAPEWQQLTYYLQYQLVSRSGTLYQVNTTHTSTTSFDASKFTAIGGGAGATSTPVGNLGATHTFTNTSLAEARFSGTVNANLAATISLSEGSVAQVKYNDNGTGGFTISHSGVDAWKTSTGSAPSITTTAGSSYVFTYWKIDGVTTGFWIDEPSSGGISDALRTKKMPTGAFAETFDRMVATSPAAAATSGALTFSAIALYAGQVVTNITFVSGNQAAVTPTHWWFCLYDKNKNKLGVTADQTTTAWAADTAKTLALTTPYTVPTTDIYYVGIVITAGTVPNLFGKIMGGSDQALWGLAPVLAASYDTGLTTPATAPAVASSENKLGTAIYAYVS